MSKELKIEYRWDEPQETQLANMSEKSRRDEKEQKV